MLSVKYGNSVDRTTRSLLFNGRAYAYAYLFKSPLFCIRGMFMSRPAPAPAPLTHQFIQESATTASFEESAGQKYVQSLHDRIPLFRLALQRLEELREDSSGRRPYLPDPADVLTPPEPAGVGQTRPSLLCSTPLPCLGGGSKSWSAWVSMSPRYVRVQIFRACISRRVVCLTLLVFRESRWSCAGGPAESSVATMNSRGVRQGNGAVD